MFCPESANIQKWPTIKQGYEINNLEVKEKEKSK